MMHNGRGGGRLCKIVSTSYSILLSREINLKAQSQYNVRAHERLPENFWKLIVMKSLSAGCAAWILSS